MDRRVVVFIATSLDGYIARPNGDVDWLFTDQDYGYSEFIAGVDTIIMGRKSYQTIVDLGEWPYAAMNVYVYTRRPTHPDDPRVTFTSVPPVELVEELRKWPGRDIWVLGGGELIGVFLDAGLIEDATIAVHPVFLGDGIPLIPRGTRTTWLNLVGQKWYENGLVILSYTVRP